MIFKLKSIKNKLLRRFLEHGIYFALVLILVPGLYFDLWIVLPSFLEKSSYAYFGHLCLTSFIIFNFVGNMYCGLFTSSTIPAENLEGFNKDEWDFCSACECLRPPRAWHCDVCEICVLHRDHHCRFLAGCVGYYNRRYFIILNLYTFIGMAGFLFYIIVYVSPFIRWNYGLILIKMCCPPLALIFDFGVESLCVLLVVSNVVVANLLGYGLYYHFNNILKGRLVPEIKRNSKDFIHNKGWKLNLIEVFGSRWYLTWISPFIHSELPGNGIELLVKNKSE